MSSDRSDLEPGLWLLLVLLLYLTSLSPNFLVLKVKLRTSLTAVKNLPANAGDTGSFPSLGKIPHAVEQLNPRATTTEPVL